MCDKTRSEITINLDTALLKVRDEMLPIKKKSDNPFFKSKYADLTTTIRALDPLFRKHGILVLQGSQESYRDNDVVLNITTELTHVKSGEYRISTLTLPLSKQDPQQLGSAVTYGRRYLWQLVAGAEVEDDDGNTAVFGSSAPTTAVKKSAPGKFKGKGKASTSTASTPSSPSASPKTLATKASTASKGDTSAPKATTTGTSAAKPLTVQPTSPPKTGTASKFGKKKPDLVTDLPSACETTDGAFSYQPKD
jgi:hypothetical protein